MPFNGAGVFNRLYSWVNDAANGIKIRADRMDNEMNGMATGLSTCVTRDGQSPATANLPMGGFKHTNAAEGTAVGEYLTYGQFFTSTKDQNASSLVRFINPNTGNAAGSQFTLSNSIHDGSILMYSTGYTPVGSILADSMRVVSDGVGGLLFETTIAAASQRWWTNGAQSMILDAGHNLNVMGTIASAGASVGTSQSYFTSSGGAGGGITLTGFGRTTTIPYNGGFSTTDGNGIQIVCISAGVVLTNGNNVWQAISSRDKKKNIQPLPIAGLDTIDQLKPVLYHYKTDSDDWQLRPGFIWEDTVEVYKYATSLTPASDVVDPETDEVHHREEMKTLSLEQFMPLVVKALQEQIQINRDLQSQIDSLK